MIHYINSSQINSVAFPLREILIQNAGLMIEYKNDPNQIHKFFTATILIDLIQKSLNPHFRIRNIVNRETQWDVLADDYSSSDTELVLALWKACIYSYDPEIQRKEEERLYPNMEGKDEPMVSIKYRH